MAGERGRGHGSHQGAGSRTSQGVEARNTRSGTTRRTGNDVQVRVDADGLRGTSGTVTQVSTQCQFCYGSPLDNDAIGCDTCESWYHGSTLCTGLKQETIAAILGEDTAAIRFICSQCRCSPSGGVHLAIFVLNSAVRILTFFPCS